MKVVRNLTAVLCIFLVVSVAMTSCETSGTAKKPGSDGVAKSGSFLETDYEPLDEWFEERFEVKYAHMKPSVVFDQVPINQIKYETENLPSGPLFELESDNISRREILKEIADFWNLKMTIKDGPDGKPGYVHVKGRG